MKRFGPAPRADIRYARRPGAYGVILDARGRALLALNESPGEEIALPGGGIDPRESALQALHREAMEETGWRISPIARVGAYRRFTYMPEYDLWAEKICHVYLARALRQVAEPIEPDHQPVFADAGLAARILSVDGDRAMFARAIGLA